jgi:hypothetical protein
MQSPPLYVIAPPSIITWIGTEVQGATNDIVAALRKCPVVATGLSDVNFSGSRPVSIPVVLGQHPDSGPKPIASRKLGDDFDAAKLNRRAELGVNTSRLDGINNRAIGGICDGNTVLPVYSGAAVAPQVDDMVVLDESGVL